MSTPAALTGILLKLYEEALDDTEYKSASFWNAYLQYAFSDQDVYSVTSGTSPDEAPPNESLESVDVAVKRYDAALHTLQAVLWVKCERPAGDIMELESQALDAAMRCIVADGLPWIYAMTTVGVSFRTWFVEKGRPELQPVDGTAVQADRGQYIDVATDSGVLANTINLAKTRTPLEDAPVIPN